MKTQSAQLIVILFPLVISTVQGTHAAVAALFHTCKVYKKNIVQIKTFTKYPPLNATIILCPKTGQFTLNNSG